MNKRQKRWLMRIVVGAAVLVAAALMPVSGYLRLACFLVPYLIVGGDVLLAAVRNISRGQVFDENFLMSIATIGAFCVGEYPEGVAVMLFYQVGELFQSYAVNRSRTSIASLMDIRPDYANIEREGKLIQVDPEEVAVGDTIIVKAGEKIPLDGVVVKGYSMADTSALTGESVPRELAKGSTALSGCVNISGLLSIEVTKEFGESTVSKILDLVENASSKKAKAENFITKFARYYTPAVVVAAALLAVVPPLLIGDAVFSEWIHRALIFLVISCPCALVISVPLSFFGGIGGASKCGILVKGSNYLEVLAETETVVFDKTGTLTKGTFRVTEIFPAGTAYSREDLLEIAALAESFSDHPISQSLKNAYGKEIDNSRISDVEEVTGKGIRAVVEGRTVLAGNIKLMDYAGISYAERDAVKQTGTIVHVAVDGVYAGHIVISDEIKEDAAEAVQALKKAGVKKTVMLTGDVDAVARKVGEELGLDEVYSELLPTDKVEKLEALLSGKSEKKKLAFAGDGINDAPVLALADVGIAMGGLGSDAAIEAADVVIMDDRPSQVANAIHIARKTIRIVKQNIIFALAVKGLVLILGAFGVATMWEAVFADVGVSVIAILNAMRALNVKPEKSGAVPDEKNSGPKVLLSEQV